MCIPGLFFVFPFAIKWQIQRETTTVQSVKWYLNESSKNLIWWCSTLESNPRLQNGRHRLGNGSLTIFKRIIAWGSGCVSVGKVVASDTRGPWFESRHRQSFYWILFTVNWSEKTKVKKKRPGMSNLKKELKDNSHTLQRTL